MAITVTNEGEPILLEALVGKTAAAQIKLKLFTNNFTPAHDSTLASFVEMGAVQGYVKKTLAMATWNAAVAGTGVGTALANKASITYPTQTWTADGTGGAQTVYGYFVTNDAETKVLWAEKFVTPATMSTAGDLINIDPKLTFSTE